MSRRRRAGQVIKLEPQEGVDPRVLRQKEQNRKFVSFSKRRYGLFSKDTDFCLKFDAQIAILVLSPAGRPYSFGHSSVDAVLNRYFKIAQAPCSSSGVLTVDDQEQRDKIQELRKQLENHKKRKRENEIAEKEKVSKVKESIKKELQTCKTVEELVAFKQKYSVLLDNINKRLKKSPINKRQCISIKSHPKSEDHLWSSNLSTLNFESGHHVVVDHEHPRYNNCSFQDVVNRQCVSIKAIDKSENISPPSSSINFEIDHHHQGNNGGSEGFFNQDNVFEGMNAQCVSIRPTLISEDTPPNTTLTTVADHHVSNGNSNGNGNDNDNGEGSFSWNAEDLENYLLRQDLEDIGGPVDETRYAAMLNYFIGEDGNDPNGAIDVSPAEHVVFPATNSPFDPVGSSDFTQHNTTNHVANRYYGCLEDIINNPYSH